MRKKQLLLLLLLLLLAGCLALSARGAKADNLLPNPSFEGATWQINENNTNFEDWEIGRNQNNGTIKTWAETSIVHSGGKALHWRTESPPATGLELSYLSNSSKKIEINESVYIEAGLWTYLISGSYYADISLYFYSANGSYLGRFWGRNPLSLGYGSNKWNRISYLWYPSSAGSGNGYIPAGAKKAYLKIYLNYRLPGIRERIDDDVFLWQHDHLPVPEERLGKNLTDLRLVADYGSLQGVSNLSYGAHVSHWDDFFTGGPNQSLWSLARQFNFTHMRFQYAVPLVFLESCKYWNTTTDSCDTTLQIDGWDIAEYESNGIIRTWQETENTRSGSKAFHHYTEAPDPTSLTLSYYSNMFPVNESRYYEAGFWSYPIQGARSYDVTLHFYDAEGRYLARRWGRVDLGSFQTGSWGRRSSLWRPSSLGQGDGYIEQGAKYAKLQIYINYLSPGIKEAIDDSAFAREFDHLPSSEERAADPSTNLVTNPSFEDAELVRYSWTNLDKAIQAIKAVGAQPVISLPIGTWGNANYLPKYMPLNYSLPQNGSDLTPGYFPALDSYCEYVRAIVNHTNIEKGFNVRYWEIGNEPGVCNSTIADAYIGYFNRAEACMHDIDPSILITSDRSNLRPFADNFSDRAQNVGFLSFHYYEIGCTCMNPCNKSNANNVFYPPNDENGWETDVNIMLKTNQLSYEGNRYVGCSGAYSPKEMHDLWKQKRGRDLEIIATEVNLNSAWQNGTDHRQDDIFGAMWYAAKAKAYILDGSNLNLNYFVLIANQRNIKSSPMWRYGGFGFGMINYSYPYDPYAPYWPNYLLTKYFPKGSLLYHSQSSEPDAIDVLAARQGSSMNILLINRLNLTASFTLPILGFAVKNATLHLLDNTTYIQRYEPSLNMTVIYKSSIRSTALPKDNVQKLTFSGYTVAVLEVLPEAAAPYLAGSSPGLDPDSATWNQKNYSIRCNAPSGTNSSVTVYWPYSNAPAVQCAGCLAYDWHFDPGSRLATLNATHSSPVTWTLQVFFAGDVTNNGCVDISDMSTIALDFGRTSGFADPDSDINENGVVDIFDLVAVGRDFGAGC